jgi:putative ABC transport system permease protein
MWTITLRDLQFRRRRFAIAILGTGLVFAMTLIMSGMSAGFRAETHNTVQAVGADAWIIRAGTAGPFTAFATATPQLQQAIAREPGVRKAELAIIGRRTMPLPGRILDLNLFGYTVGGIVHPPITKGRAPERPGEAAVDSRAGVPIGFRLVLGGDVLRVVGFMHGISWFGGVPGAFVPLQDAQRMIFDGRQIGTTIITRGTPAGAPAGFAVASSEAVRQDMLRPIKNGIKSIDNIEALLWMVAALIIGTVVYLSALERVRDFAVLKALGGSSGSLFGGLALQAMVVALIAAVLGVVVATLLAPRFALLVVIPHTAYGELPLIGLLVGLIASLSGLRRAVSVDPALAFGGP